MRRLLSADFLKWFYPGMHIKRWLGLMIIGVAILTFGLAYILREAYVSGFTFPGFVYYLTLQFIPRYVRGVMFMLSAGGRILPALADPEPLVTSLFQYRFSDGSGLAGHSFGNLFFVAMSGVVGNFEEAIRQTSRVPAVRGQIIPSTLANVTLCARTDDERTIQGESLIGKRAANDDGTNGRIRQVYLVPQNPPAHPEAVRAILEADLVILGPGSLYTRV